MLPEFNSAKRVASLIPSKVLKNSVLKEIKQKEGGSVVRAHRPRKTFEDLIKARLNKGEIDRLITERFPKRQEKVYLLCIQ